MRLKKVKVTLLLILVFY